MTGDAPAASPLARLIAQENRAAVLHYLAATPRDALLDAVTQRDENGMTPLHNAVRRGWADVTAALLRAGADPAATDKNLMNAYHHAAFQPAGIMSMLLAHPAQRAALRFCPFEATVADSLRLALYACNMPVVETLVAFGANINDNTQDGQTPLQWLLANRKDSARALPFIRYLLAAGADNDADVNDRGETPLLVAAKTNYPEAIALLLDAGADPLRRNFSGMTALHLAAKFYPASTAALLLDAGIDPDAQNSAGQTALHIAARGNKRDFVAVLLARGADAGLRDKDNNTAGMLCLGPHQQTVRAMLDAALAGNAPRKTRKRRTPRPRHIKKPPFKPQ